MVTPGKMLMRSLLAAGLLSIAGIGVTQKPVVSPAAASLNVTGALINDDDYPPDALRAGEHGSVTFSLDVGANGEPSDCTIIQGSGSGSLDRATCTLLLLRAHFTPAHGSDGKPIAGRYASRVNWNIPTAAGKTKVVFDGQGDAVVCHASVGGKPVADWTPRKCHQLVVAVRGAVGKLPASVVVNPALTAPPALGSN